MHVGRPRRYNFPETANQHLMPMESVALATPPVEIETAAKPLVSIIWLHGLGADGHDFEPIVPELNLPADIGVRFVFPHAPPRAVTLNQGLVMRAWYDIALTADGFWQNAEHIGEAERIVHVFIQRERERGISVSRIVLAGFSQGGAIALRTALRYPEPVAGVMALSGYLPLHESVAKDVHPANRNVPIFMAHGEQDPVVPLALALRSKEILEREHYQVDWHVYPIPHGVSPDEIQAVADWLMRVLGTMAD
ncbi:MAG: alpha/beta hydrolase [Acidiferrobacterales bacterium]